MENLKNEDLEKKISELRQNSNKMQKKQFLGEDEIVFRSIFDNLIEGCQILDFDWRYLYINNSAEKQNRRPKEELLGNRYIDMWPDIETTEVFSKIKQCLEQRKSFQLENEFIFPDQSHGWFELNIQPIPEGVFILSYNITERKLIELKLKQQSLEIQNQKDEIERQNEVLRITNEKLSDLNMSLEEKVNFRTIELSKSEDKFKRFFEEDLTGDFIINEQGTILDCNKSFLEIYGYNNKREVINKKIYEFYTDFSEFEFIKTQLIKNKTIKDYETRRKRKNGELIDIIENKIATFENDKIIEIKGCAYDITERKKMEQALKASKEKYRRQSEMLEEINEEYQAINEELQNTLEEIHNLNKTLERQNEELDELNATKDKFFSIISHDLRNPFTSILSSSELLQIYVKKNEPEKILKFAKNIHNAVILVNKLLENLIGWSRLQTGKLTPKFEKFNLKIIAREICLLYSENAQSKNIKIQNNIITDTFVNCDPEMTKTIFRNLITNAIKFTNSNGVISINAKKSDELIEITISDTGVGIKPENIPFLFSIEKNISTIGTNEEYGTGLGLLLCKELIDKQGGDIWVKSEVGIGSEFIFTIPVYNVQIKNNR